MFRFSGQPTVYIAPSFAVTAKNLPDLPFVNGLSIGGVTQLYTPPAPPALDSTISNLAVPVPTGNPTIAKQTLTNTLAALFAPIVQAVADCINSLVQEVIFFKNVGTALIKDLENIRVPNADQIIQSIEQGIQNEVNSLKHTKISFGVSAQIRSNIMNQSNIACMNATPLMLREYVNNPPSIGIAANIAAKNITANLNSQLLIPSAPSSVGWNSLI